MDVAAHGDRGAVAGTQQAERAATEAVIVAAAGHIEDAGHQATEAFRQRMQTTVRAAQLDPDVAERWRGGRLETDEEASVFGLAPGAMAPEPARRAARTRTAPPPSAPSGGADEPGDTDPAGDAEAVATADRATAREAEERRREAVATHQRLRKEADRLDNRATRLEAKAEHLEQQAEGARREADDARAAADDARAAADDADPDRPDGPSPG